MFEGEAFFWKFDKLQDFSFYYPYYNSPLVLKRWNIVYYSHIAKRKKSIKLKAFLMNSKNLHSIVK